MSVSIKNIKILLVGILIPAMILMHAINPIINTNYLYIIYFIILAFSVLENSIIPINRITKIFYICTIVSMAIIPIFVFNVKSLSSGFYVALLIVFLIVVDFSGQILLKNTKKIINIWVYIGTLIVDCFLFTHLDEINADTIMAVFYSGNQRLPRFRADFGFTHPNFTAIALTTLLFCIYLKMKYAVSQKEKILCIILIAIHALPFFCTGSRTAAISVTIFLLLEFVLKIVDGIKNQKIRFFLYLITIITVIGASVNVFDNANSYKEEFSDLTSGRYGTIISGLNILGHQGKLWFGNEVSNVSTANKALQSIGAITSDNWYYLQIARFGIIGTIIFMIGIIIALCYLFNSFNKRYIESAPFSALVCLLIYGLGENVVYNQGVSLCAVVLIYIFMCIWKSIESESNALIVRTGL